MRRCWAALPPLFRQMIRFGSVSATALAVDVTAYAALVPNVEPAALSAFAAYCIGGLWHYSLSSARMPPASCATSAQRWRGSA
jgi:putative flippase GtrA